ncbi:MAG: hypothetical protein ABIQ11_12025, partial [Saprospiraceae bacterium]
ITRTWRATDDCGNSSSCTQVITVDDSTPPVITCPQGVSVSCASQVPAPGGATATDNCSTPTITNTDVITNMTCVNRFNLTRTYIATDACGNSATCTQLIVVSDNTGPSITCPANVTVQCASQVPPSNTGSVVTSDNCGGTVTVTFSSDVITNMTCANRFNITRTYTATDICLNSSSCTQTITVFDNTLPTLTCPPPVTVSCASAVPPPAPGSVTSTDNCGGSATITHVGDVISNQTCANRFVVTRTYRATDACLNSATCTQLITVNDVTPPVITCPPNITVDFGSSTAPGVTGNASATDNCGGTPVITFTDMIVAGICDEQFTINRTFRATDACQNSSTCLQTIFVDGDCIVDLSLTKDLDSGQEAIEGGDLVTFTITVTNEGEVTISSVTIIDYIPVGFSLADPDWTPGTEGSTGISATITLSIANGGLDPDGLDPGESVSVQITLQADEDIEPGLYENIAEILMVLDDSGDDVTGDDIDSDPDDDDLNDPESEDDHDIALICVLPTPMITGDAFVCPGDIVTYSVDDYNPDFTYTFELNGGGVIISSTDSSITVEWQDEPGGPFQITLVVDAGFGCDATVFLIVFIQGDEILTCNDHINLSIGPDGEIVLLSGMILEGEVFGDDNYLVIIIDQNGDTVPNATLTCEHVGQTFTVKVLSECNGNSCWGTVTVEDKLPPQIVCECPIGGVEITGFSGTLDVNSPLFTRPNTTPQGGNCTVSGFDVPYITFPFYLDMDGSNQFDVVTFTAGSGDSFLALYVDSFDPTQPCANLVAADDDAGPGFLSQIIATLEADRVYILVVTTFNNDGDDYGDFIVS